MEIGMDGPPEAATRTRSVQACQSCRALKARCLPSEELGICQRRFSAGRECARADKVRIRKKRGPSRIYQMQQKLDGLVARFGDADSPNQRHAPKELAFLTASSDASQTADSTHGNIISNGFRRNQRQDNLQDLISIHDFSHSSQDNSLDPTEPVAFDGFNDNHGEKRHEIFQDVSSNSDVESLLAEYRDMTQNFVFVPIPQNVTMQELRAKKPMLFLAIMTVASWKDSEKQMSLSKRYRHELAQKAIIHPQKDFCLVQSLLVYLSWYHFNFNHKPQNIQPLLCMHVGTALDVGINQKRKRSIMLKRNPIPPSPSQEREEQRSLLGCFCLSSAITTDLQKPSLLGYTNYMLECTQRLAKDHEYDSDDLIQPTVTARQIDQSIYHTFHADEQPNLSVDDPNLFSQLDLLKSRLKTWRRDCQLDDYYQLDLSYYYANMELHGTGLLPMSDTEGVLMSWSGENNGRSMNVLHECLESAKSFLDTLLDQPVTEYHRIMFIDWMRMPRAILTICKLSFPSSLHPPQWDVKAVRDRVRFDLYLDSFCYRVQTIRAFKTSGKETPDFWMTMQKIMELVRVWYVRKTHPSAQACSVSSRSVKAAPCETSIVGDFDHADSGKFQFPNHSGRFHGSVFNPESELHVDPNDFEASTSDPGIFMQIDFDIDQFLNMEF